MNDLHDFRVFQDGLDFWIVVDCLHDGVILHLFLLLFRLFVRNLVEVVPRERTELHQQLSELRVLSILLHGFLRLGTHFLQDFHGGRVGKRGHEPGAFHDFLHEARCQPLVLRPLQAVLQVVLNFIKAQVLARVLRLEVRVVLNDRCFGSGRCSGLGGLCRLSFLLISTEQKARFEATEASRGLLLCRRLLLWLLCGSAAYFLDERALGFAVLGRLASVWRKIIGAGDARHAWGWFAARCSTGR